MGRCLVDINQPLEFVVRVGVDNDHTLLWGGEDQLYSTAARAGHFEKKSRGEFSESPFQVNSID